MLQGSAPGVAVVMKGTLMPLLSANVTVDTAVEPTPFFETTTVKAYTEPPVKVPEIERQGQEY